MISKYLICHTAIWDSNFLCTSACSERQGLNNWFGFSKGMFARMRAFPPRSLVHNGALRQSWGWGPRDGAWPAALGPSSAASLHDLASRDSYVCCPECVDPNVNLKSQFECSLKFSSVLGWWLCWWLWQGSGSTGISIAEIWVGQRPRSLFFCYLEEGRNREHSVCLLNYCLSPLWLHLWSVPELGSVSF